MNTNATAIINYLKAKKALAEAKAAEAAAKAALLALMDGQTKANWEADGHEYTIAATYGKTRRDLNADLIREVLGVEVTEGCYKTSKSWDEVRVTIEL